MNPENLRVTNMISLPGGSKKLTQMSLSTKQQQTTDVENKTYGYQRGSREGRIDRHRIIPYRTIWMGATDTNTTPTKQISNNTALLNRTENYIQYLV